MTLDLRALGIAAPGPGASPDAPEVALHWLVTMDRHARRAPAAVDPLVLSRFEARLAGRPARDEALGQLHIDAPSCLRRARVVAERLEPGGQAIAIGDDDVVTLALEELGVRATHAVDLDPRLLAWLRAEGVATTRADVMGSSVPDALRGRFEVAVTDPFRDLDGGLGFLCYAAACVRPGGDLLWVDHPDWNYEHDEVARAMAALGWRVVEVHEGIHRYPMDAAAFDSVARAFAELAETIRALAARAVAVSNLYRLRRD